MKKRLLPFLSLLWLCSVLFSCGTSRKVVTVEPSNMDVVRSHLQSPNPAVLLNDLKSFPEYAMTIEPCLYGISYQQFGYPDLERFAQQAKSDVRASLFFDSLLVDRQASTLAYLSQQVDLEKVADYYRKNGKEMPFLKPAMKASYFSSVESMDYTGLKSLYFAFRGTDLEPLVFPRYSSVRKDLLSKIMQELNPYFAKEQTMLKEIDAGLRKDCQKYIEDGVRTVMVNMSEKVDRGFWDKMSEWKAMDSYSIEQYADKLIAENISGEYIRGLVEERLSNYVQSTTRMRFEYLMNYRPDVSQCQDYFMAGRMGLNTDFSMVADASGAERISNAKFVSGALSVASTVLGFFSGHWFVKLLNGASFLDDLTGQSRMEAQISQMSNELYTTVARSVDDYLNSQIKWADDAREASKQYIIKTLNEDF